MKDYATVALGFDRSVRIITCNTTNLSETARKIHDLWPTSSQALSRCLTINLMMNILDKNHTRIGIKIETDGIIDKICTEASMKKVKGYVSKKEVLLQNNDKSINIEKALGDNGIIHVTKQLNNGELFQSSTNLITKDLAKDFAYYYSLSEQINSSIGLGAINDVDNSIIGACGFIIQVMPDCSDEVITFLESHLPKMKSCSEMLKEGYTPEDMIREITNNDCKILKNIDLEYECDCTKDRFYKGIKSLGFEEINLMIKEGNDISVRCNFCNTNYIFTIDDLKEMIKNTN